MPRLTISAVAAVAKTKIHARPGRRTLSIGITSSVGGCTRIDGRTLSSLAAARITSVTTTGIGVGSCILTVAIHVTTAIVGGTIIDRIARITVSIVAIVTGASTCSRSGVRTARFDATAAIVGRTVIDGRTLP
jgi:hypothetical protein